PAEYTNYGDPLETYPIDTARLRRVVELVADKAEWGKKLPPRHGQGIAAHRSFLSYVATVVEVAVDEKGRLTVPRVDTAIDCGFAANPERIYSQVEGAAVMGLSLARYGEISWRRREHQARHPRVSGNPGRQGPAKRPWTPAFAGVTNPSWMVDSR